MKNKRSILDVNPKVSTIIEAGLGKRVFSGILDGVLFAFLSILLALWVFTPIANSAMGYEQYQLLGTQYQIASHLYVYYQQTTDNNFEVIEAKDFTEKLDTSKAFQIVPIYQHTGTNSKFYLEHVYYYYHSFLTNGPDVELPNPSGTRVYDPVNDHFVSPHYNEKVKDTNLLPIEYYTDDWIAENVFNLKNNESEYFVRDTSKIKFVDQMIVKEGVDNNALVNFLKERAYSTNNDLYNSDYFVSINNNIKGIQIFLIIPSVTISYMIFFMLVPLLFANGETFGKKFNKLAIISMSGYKVKKSQIVFRQLVLYLCLMLFSFMIGVGLTSIATLFAGIAILFLITLTNKHKRCVHDFAAFTMEVDAAKSVWFESANKEEKVYKELEEKMAKYSKNKVENKNIIQIGDQIVDEQLKREIEEKNKKV